MVVDHNDLNPDIKINENWECEWMESDLFPLVKANNSQMGNDSEEYSELDNVDESVEMSEDSDDIDLQEDQIAADRMAQLTGSPLPSILQFEHIEEEIYSCAPGENNTPIIF